jgi:hypothetical protein
VVEELGVVLGGDRNHLGRLGLLVAREGTHIRLTTSRFHLDAARRECALPSDVLYLRPALKLTVFAPSSNIGAPIIRRLRWQTRG